MDDEQIKQLSQKAGLSEEEAKQKVNKTEEAMGMGAGMMIAAIETEINTQLTDKQKEHIKMAYELSLMFTIMGIK